MIIPSETPLADDVDFERLSRHQICGGDIKNAVFRAAAEAALRSEGKLEFESELLLQPVPLQVSAVSPWRIWRSPVERK